MTAPSPDRPDTWIPAALAMRDRWQFCRDLRGGTEVLRAQCAKYLPKFEAEHPIDYTARVSMTFADDALGRTIDTLVGLAFTTEPELQANVAARLRAEWENLDGEGTHGTVFAQQVLDSALQDGHCLILAEYPPVEASITLAQERALGIRAYLVRVALDQVPSWRVMTWGGRRILAQLVIETKDEQPDGRFGVRTLTQYRVYRQRFDDDGTPYVEWELWEKGDQEITRLGEPARLRGPRFIPVAPVFGGQRTGFLESRPPLLGLAHSNLQHTQLASDQAMLLHKCAVPQFVATGVANPDDLKIGNSVWKIPAGGDAKVLEITGTSLETRRKEMTDLERRMADQGIAMLQRDTAAPRTATEIEFSRTRQESKLARAVRSLQDALEASLGFMAEYYGMDATEGGELVLRRDFSALTLSDADLAVLRAMEEGGQLTLETFLALVRQKGGVWERIDPAQEAEALRRERAEKLDFAEGLLGAGAGGRAVPVTPPVEGDAARRPT